MKVSDSDDAWLFEDAVSSTQDALAEHLRSNSPVRIVVANSQSQGRGRFDRRWESPEGALAMSIAFDQYKDAARPWLVGMASACAAAGALHCRLQWPNDLTLENKKLGGILTQIIDGIPVVGIGANLSVNSFGGDLATVAISLHEFRAQVPDPKSCAREIVNRLREMPEPTGWDAIQPIWNISDSTPGKKYRLSDGSEATAIGIGPEGELIASVDGETISVFAADAMLGPQI